MASCGTSQITYIIHRDVTWPVLLRLFVLLITSSFVGWISSFKWLISLTLICFISVIFSRFHFFYKKLRPLGMTLHSHARFANTFEGIKWNNEKFIKSFSLRKKCQYSEIFWSVFFRIWTEYERYGVSPVFSANTGKEKPEKLRIWTLLKQCFPQVKLILSKTTFSRVSSGKFWKSLTRNFLKSSPVVIFIS